MKPFAAYTLARLGMFVIIWVPVWVVASMWADWGRTTAIWSALIAWVVSALLSFVWLRGLRDRLAERTQQRVGRLRQRYGEASGKEDAD